MDQVSRNEWHAYETTHCRGPVRLCRVYPLHTIFLKAINLRPFVHCILMGWLHTGTQWPPYANAVMRRYQIAKAEVLFSHPKYEIRDDKISKNHELHIFQTNRKLASLERRAREDWEQPGEEEETIEWTMQCILFLFCFKLFFLSPRKSRSSSSVRERSVPITKNTFH